MRVFDPVTESFRLKPPVTVGEFREYTADMPDDAPLYLKAVEGVDDDIELDHVFKAGGAIICVGAVIDPDDDDSDSDVDDDDIDEEYYDGDDDDDGDDGDDDDEEELEDDEDK